MDCSNCCETIALVVSVLTLACNVIMIFIMQIELKPETTNLQQKFDYTFERSKKRPIYERYFDTMGKLDNFRDLVKKAYSDIMKQIPHTSDDYKQEDWRLAEWLIIDRKYDTNIEIDEREHIRNSLAKYLKLYVTNKKERK